MVVSVKPTGGKARKAERVLPLRPTVRTWALHWISTFLALFLLATSLASAFALLNRPFPAMWMDLHLSTGIALLVITLVRIATVFPFGKMRRSTLFGRKGAAAIKYWLVVVVLVTALTGLLIYQKPVLGKNSYLFSLIPMPTIIRLDHTLHNLIINFHIILSSILLILIAAHLVAGLRRKQWPGRSQLSVMLWPW